MYSGPSSVELQHPATNWDLPAVLGLQHFHEHQVVAAIVVVEVVVVDNFEETRDLAGCYLLDTAAVVVAAAVDDN